MSSRDPFNDNQGCDDTLHSTHGYEGVAMSQNRLD